MTGFGIAFLASLSDIHASFNTNRLTNHNAHHFFEDALRFLVLLIHAGFYGFTCTKPTAAHDYDRRSVFAHQP